MHLFLSKENWNQWKGIPLCTWLLESKLISRCSPFRWNIINCLESSLLREEMENMFHLRKTIYFIKLKFSSRFSLHESIWKHTVDNVHRLRDSWGNMVVADAEKRKIFGTFPEEIYLVLNLFHFVLSNKNFWFPQTFWSVGFSYAWATC